MPAPRRRCSTRQRKAKEIVDKEGDKEFWNQEALAEAESDEEFDVDALSDEGEDIVDSDFDIPEEREEEEEAAHAAEREVRDAERLERRKRRNARYKDPALKRKSEPDTRQTHEPPKKKVFRKDLGSGSSATVAERRGLRKSTRQRSEKAAEKRKRKLAEEEERKRERLEREKRKPKVKILTQEEMLEEAKETEIKNREDLKILLRLEEEKKRLPPPKKPDLGSKITLTSAKGSTKVSFTDKTINVQAFMFPRYLPPRLPAKPAVCVVTGAPARYKDPKTGLPYADAAAFKRIRASPNPLEEFSTIKRPVSDQDKGPVPETAPDTDVPADSSPKETSVKASQHMSCK